MVSLVSTTRYVSPVWCLASSRIHLRPIQRVRLGSFHCRRPESTYLQALRTLSTAIPPTNGKAEDEGLVLFERGSENYTIMRSGLGVSCLHTAYWIWYTTDFIPLVNASPMEDLHIDPMLGVVGIMFGALINAAFILYPRRLISRLVYKPDRIIDGGQEVPAQFWLYTHTLPAIQPGKRPMTVIPAHSEEDPKWSLLDTASDEADEMVKRVLAKELDGYRERVVINAPGRAASMFPYLLEFREDTTVPDPNLFVQALLYPNQFSTTSTAARPRIAPELYSTIDPAYGEIDSNTSRYRRVYRAPRKSGSSRRPPRRRR